MPPTQEQRTANLKRANEVRIAQARAKRRLKRRETSLREVLEDTPDLLGSMRVGDLLEALPRVGSYRAQTGLTALQINPQRSVGALTQRQRGLIVGRFE